MRATPFYGVRIRAWWPMLALCAGSAGCPPPPGVSDLVPPGPPRATDEIVARIEDNAGRMTQALWSNGVHATARFKDEEGIVRHYNLEGACLLQLPRNLWMQLRPGLGDPVMGLGSNASDFWVWIAPKLGTLYWGHHANAGQTCAGTMPIRPDHLLTALGVGGLPKREGVMGPVRRYGREYDILAYLRRTREGLFVDREYWVERSAPFMIRLVNFRDEMGRIILSANLEEYRSAWPDGPLAPHEVSLIWPLDEARFTMSMDRVEGRPAEKVSASAFDRPTSARPPGGIDRFIQVDADCDRPWTSGAREPFAP